MCGARNLSKNKPLLLHPPFGLGEKTIKNFRHFSFFSTFSLFFCSKLERVRMKQNIKPTRVVKCSLAGGESAEAQIPNGKPQNPNPKRKWEKGNEREGTTKKEGNRQTLPFISKLAFSCRFDRHGPIRYRYPARSRLEATPAFVTKIANKRIRITPRKRRNE